MFARHKDLFLIATLIFLGISVTGCVYLMGQSFRSHVLEQEAHQLAETWATKTGALFTTPDASAEAISAGLFSLQGEARKANIDSLSLYKPDGSLVAQQTITSQNALRGSIDDAPRNIEGVTQALKGQTDIKALTEQQGETSSVTLQVATPLRVNGTIIGALALEADQSGMMRVLGSSLGGFSSAAVTFVWIAFFIPTVIVWQRIKERLASDNRLDHVSQHDTLTDLPNRILFTDRLTQALLRAERKKGRVAVLSIDLDRFADINDTMGHETGDALLKLVAERLIEVCKPTDTIARIGGDEFMIIAEEIASPEEASDFAGHILNALAGAYQLNGSEIIGSASMGLSISPDDGTDPHILMKNADLALYRAKTEARGSYRFFEAAMDAEMQMNRELEQEMRKAIRDQRFLLHYQAQYDVGSDKLSGYEALIRWPHPTKGLISPALFIPVAESSGLIVQLGEWVLREACKAALNWEDHITIAVNLSPAQFKNNDVASMVERVLAETTLPPRRLELEITEGLLIQNPEYVTDQLDRIRALGVSIAMDDFGTGYSSLSYIARFPFDKIKIDGSFIQTMAENPKLEAIVHTIIGLGTRLDMKITAEGVETDAQMDVLKDFGCPQVQGFLFGKPMPEHQTEQHERLLGDLPAVADMPLDIGSRTDSLPRVA